MTHDDALLERIGTLALGALPAAEASQLRGHIAGCALCRAEYTACRATADLVACAAEVPQLDELAERRMKSRVMRAVRAAALSTSEHARPLACKTRLGDLYACDSDRFPVDGGEVIRRGEKLYLAMYRTPKLSAGRVWQIWTLKTGAAAVAPSVTFTTAENGGALVLLPIPATGITTVALSEEPAGGSAAPTSKPAFVRKLS